LEYLLNSSQAFRDMSRGKQVEQLRADLGWCASSIPTVLRSLVFWQSQARVAPASPSVEARRIRKARRNHDTGGSTGRRCEETLAQFQERILSTLPPDLRDQAGAQLAAPPQQAKDTDDGAR